MRPLFAFAPPRPLPAPAYGGELSRVPFPSSMAVVPKKSNFSKSSSPNVVAAARGGRRRRSGAWENVKSILGAVLIFLFIRHFLVEAFRIPSGSMIPTLLVGDWLFVNKAVYGPHIPFTDIALPGYAEPSRNEVVVFKSPPQLDQPWDPTPTLVKRLVAVPGDTIYMRGGLFHVNGVPKPQPPEAARNRVGDGSETSPLFAWQHNHELRDTRFGPPPSRPTHDDWGPLLVPPARYFMLGDNRYDSKDGRYWGLVPRENLRGRPLFIYYSWNAESERPLAFITEIRWDRIGNRIR